MSVKIINKGQFDIHHFEGVLKAGGVASVSKEVADKLRSLYKDAVFSVEDMFKQFETSVENIVDDAKESLSTKELKAKARSLGLKVPHGSTDEEIAALIEAA